MVSTAVSIPKAVTPRTHEFLAVTFPCIGTCPASCPFTTKYPWLLPWQVVSEKCDFKGRKMALNRTWLYFLLAEARTSQVFTCHWSNWSIEMETGAACFWQARGWVHPINSCHGVIANCLSQDRRIPKCHGGMLHMLSVSVHKSTVQEVHNQLNPQDRLLPCTKIWAISASSAKKNARSELENSGSSPNLSRGSVSAVFEPQ